MPDGPLVDWTANFINAATAHQAELGLSQADLDVLADEAAGFRAARENHFAAVALAAGAKQAKDASKSQLLTSLRHVTNRIQASPTVAADLKEQLGLILREGHYAKPTPCQPAGLEATGSDSGVNFLRWRANGNGYPTLYIIEARPDDASPWTIVDTTTKTKFAHAGQTPGVRMRYRVTAKRRSDVSLPSAVAMVYGSASSPAEDVAASVTRLAS
jgi:hypothetical protein